MTRAADVTATEVMEVFAYWARVMGKQKAFLDKPRDTAIRKAIHMGATIDECKRAIDGCKASRWHMGDNDRRLVYNDLALILRDAQHIERFMEEADTSQNREANRRRIREEYDSPKRGMPEWAREKARHLKLLKPPPRTQHPDAELPLFREAY